MTDETAAVAPTWAGAEVPEPFARFVERVNEIDDIGRSLSVLGWDREVNTPPGGVEARVTQMVTLGSFLHRMATSDEFGEALEGAASAIVGLDMPEAHALVRVVRREFEQQRAIGTELERRISEVSGRAHTVWIGAREADDFQAFRPWLEQIVELGREIADRLGFGSEPYDALLDRFEIGATTDWVAGILDRSKAALVPLREAIEDRVEGGHVSIDDSVLHRDFPVEAQKVFARYLAEAVGYDLDRGHIGTAVHPFATSFGQGDCRITTRWYPDYLNASVFGTLHECGHAMYEQGTDARFARTPLAGGTSSGIHESQSRMIENIVGRSLGFWRAHYPALVEAFPTSLGDVPLEDFHRAINAVKPSLIRVEADELTYNLHIVLRFELERALVRGDLAVADLPTAWNDGMRDLLGITPPTDREGVLQDVHWTAPMFGYFPTYALGNLYAAQLHEAACASDPAISEGLSAGRVAPLLAWLRENVHRPGASLTPAELIARATGSALDPEAFTRYATEKFTAVYGLNR